MRTRTLCFRVGLALIVVISSLYFVTCSPNDECSVCPDGSAESVQWVAYDNFNDNSLNTGLWNYIEDC